MSAFHIMQLMSYLKLQHLQRRFRDFRIELGVVATSEFGKSKIFTGRLSIGPVGGH